MRRAVILAVLFAVAVAALLVLLPLRVTPAPQVTFVSIRGEAVPAAPPGKVMLVNFWATDCVVCVREMPELVRLYERYRERGLEVVAVALKHDPPNYVIRFAEMNRLPFKVALDSMGEHARAFGGIRATPTAFLIDRRGNIVERIVGMPDFGKLNALIEQKLAEGA